MIWEKGPTKGRIVSPLSFGEINAAILDAVEELLPRLTLEGRKSNTHDIQNDSEAPQIDSLPVPRGIRVRIQLDQDLRGCRSISLGLIAGIKEHKHEMKKKEGHRDKLGCRRLSA